MGSERRGSANRQGHGPTRRRVLQAGAALGALPFLPSCSGEDGRPDPDGALPNVLFVMSDAHRARDLGCYGNSVVRTPHFDALAAEGMLLGTAISNTPLCRPYRASLMSGAFGHSNGVVTNKSADNPGLDEMGRWIPGPLPTLGRAFRSAGYDCGYVGKWHLGSVKTDPGPARLGFDDYWVGAISPTHTYFDWNYATGSEGRLEGGGRFRPELEVDLALDFMTTRRDRPFLMMLSWGPPHEPFEPPPEFDHYQGLQPPPNMTATRQFSVESALLSLGRYYGLVEAIDHSFGRLMAELESAGLARDTIVIYTSDHGTMIGSHGAIGKEMPFVESTQVPFVLRWPGRVPAGSRLDMPFGAPDVLPSLCGLAGLPVPAPVDGHDFSARLLGKDEGPHQDVVYMASHVPTFMARPGWRGLRTERWMYARSKERPLMLHDLEADPYELQNLATDSGGQAASFDDQLTGLMAEVGDGWTLG
jgi:arylsulfatase A-like enzyme